MVDIIIMEHYMVILTACKPITTILDVHFHILDLVRKVLALKLRG